MNPRRSRRLRWGIAVAGIGLNRCFLLWRTQVEHVPVQIFYFPTSEAVPTQPATAANGPEAPDAAVVIDVLRATTTIAWSLQNGAEAIQAFADLDELESAAAAWPADLCLRAGERGGQRVNGYDLGNSPLAVTPELVRGKRIFMSTTNGTRSLAAVRQVPLLLTACLPNISAVARRLISAAAQRVWIVGSGWEGDYSLEDSLAAGAVVSALMEQAGPGQPEIANDNGVVCGNDEALAALALWQQWRHQPEACLRAASHGQRLIGLGNHDADFACCAAIDSLEVVPMQVEPGVLKAS
ncbi:2-phosphosulfolactate phosphatase family protein [Cyanobium sp. HWJ4-Hawea]|nr:2-phosphosulfolactate phosphatase family protein [Cyanobium sp. HWJ4-Hawea]